MLEILCSNLAKDPRECENMFMFLMKPDDTLDKMYFPFYTTVLDRKHLPGVIFKDPEYLSEAYEVDSLEDILGYEWAQGTSSDEYILCVYWKEKPTNLNTENINMYVIVNNSENSKITIKTEYNADKKKSISNVASL